MTSSSFCSNRRGSLTIFWMILLAAATLVIAATFMQANATGAKRGAEISSASLYGGISEDDIRQILDRAVVEVSKYQAYTGGGNTTDLFPQVANSLLQEYLHKKGISELNLTVIKSANQSETAAVTGYEELIDYGEYVVVISTTK